MTQRLVAPLLDFGGTPSMCVVVSNREKPMDTTASSFTARNNAKRAAEKMIANGKAPAVDYGIRPRDDGRPRRGPGGGLHLQACAGAGGGLCQPIARAPAAAPCAMRSSSN